MTQAFSCSPRLLLPSLFSSASGPERNALIAQTIRQRPKEAARVKELFFLRHTGKNQALSSSAATLSDAYGRCQSASAMRGFRACGGEKGRQKKPVKPAFLSGRQRRPVKAARPERSQQARGLSFDIGH